MLARMEGDDRHTSGRPVQWPDFPHPPAIIVGEWTGYRVGGTWSMTGQGGQMMGLLTRPLLIAGTITGPDFYSRAVGGASTSHVEAEAGLTTNNRPIGVEGPLLVRSVIAVPDLYPGSRRCGMIGHVQALVAIHLQLSIRQCAPLLVRSTVAVPDIQQRAIGRGQPWHIQAAVRSNPAQHPARPTSTGRHNFEQARAMGIEGRTEAVAEASQIGVTPQVSHGCRATEA